MVLLNLLYFYGMCGVLKECLLQRYFSKELRCGIQGAESDVIQACRRVRTSNSLCGHDVCMIEMVMILLMTCEYIYWMKDKFERDAITSSNK
ncbi:hypothetical protein RchiOBHm_Chr3g0451871 [Rosa chinensis]|uniref:Uncharacterized protein n=1 Tax=Rosa chinensis TaxID=74649 RepID=A0A2P6R678_ROSCH|nr:hypothetical protein RchiOBHm_Chr3g0451871 [Rosa chinensis]